MSEQSDQRDRSDRSDRSDRGGRSAPNHPRRERLLGDWHSTLQSTAARCRGLVKEIVVVEETDSTQDEARRRGASPGLMVVAGRQCRGRGRLGRTWLDSADAGVALSVVVPAMNAARLAVAAAVGTARACSRVALASRSAIWQRTRRNPDGPSATLPFFGLKWPNDVYVEGRKLAGVLIESDGDSAIIGIGINVSQLEWPEALRTRAVSLRQLEIECDRLAVIESLLVALGEAMQESEAKLVEAFRARDTLVNTRRRLLVGELELEGVVVALDPLRWLRLRLDDDRVVDCDAAITRVLG